MITNRVGSSVRGEDFYGREKFVELVWQKLHAGHVLLAAPRRFGKTSVMYSLIDEPRDNYKIVRVDLEHLIEPADLIAELIFGLAKDKDNRFSKVINGLSYFPKSLWSFFKSNFEEVEFLKIKIKLRDQLRSNWQEKGEELFKRIAEMDEMVIFILDEFPMMIDRMAKSQNHREEAKTLLRWLRRLRQMPETQNVRFLIAGSIGIGHVLNELGEIATINDFEQLRLEPFTPKVAKGLLEELAKSYGLELSVPVKNKMLKVIGEPIPYFIQVIFSEVAKAKSQNDEKITPNQVEKIYRDKVLGVDCKTYFDHYYGRLHAYYDPAEEKAAKRILRELALSEKLTRDICYQLYKKEIGNDTDVDKFNRMMTNLENDFYVQFDAEKRVFCFASKLLRDWWLRHYGMETEV